MSSMFSKITLVSYLFLIALAAPVPVFAQVIALDIGQPADERRNSWLPYAFATESLGTAIGVGAFSAGQFQPQASVCGIQGDPLAIYRLREGLLESGPLGGEPWNPMKSGQSTLAARYFYTYRDLSDFVFNEIGRLPIEEQLFAKTNGLEIWFEYDNTDFPRNPSRGSRQLLKISRDFGWLDSRESWTNLEADFSKYFDFGRSGWFRQRALALNFWTSSSPSWKVSADASSISHRPPPNYGSSLGGYDRMRAYPSGRFHDKSAVYYSAELRMIPQTQPLRNWPLLEYFEIDWWEIVPFVEVGRVGERYDADLFSKDLKVDVGLGLRFMTFRAVVRVDWAISEEGTSVWAMVSQPFSRQGD